MHLCTHTRYIIYTCLWRKRTGSKLSDYIWKGCDSKCELSVSSTGQRKTDRSWASGCRAWWSNNGIHVHSDPYYLRSIIFAIRSTVHLAILFYCLFMLRSILRIVQLLILPFNVPLILILILILKLPLIWILQVISLFILLFIPIQVGWLGLKVNSNGRTEDNNAARIRQTETEDNISSLTRPWSTEGSLHLTLCNALPIEVHKS